MGNCLSCAGISVDAYQPVDIDKSILTIDYEDSVIASQSMRNIENTIDEILYEDTENDINDFIEGLIYEN